MLSTSQDYTYPDENVGSVRGSFPDILKRLELLELRTFGAI